MRVAQVAVVQVAQEQVILLQMEEVKTAVQVQLHLIQDHQ
jgi:CDP-diacylglycerol pyrophosphatase